MYKRNQKLIVNNLISPENILNIRCLVCFLTLIIISACTNENKEWEKARLSNSLSSYKHFLLKYPESQYNIIAHNAIDSINMKITDSIGTWQAYQLFVDSFPNSKYIEIVKKKLRNTKINEVLKLIGKPNEVIITPMNSHGVENLKGSEFILKQLSEINTEITKTGLVNGAFEKIISKYSEYIRAKYWDISITSSDKEYYKLDELRKFLGYEEDKESGLFKGRNSKIALTWYKYGWLNFGADIHNNIIAIRGVYNMFPTPYLRLKNDSIINAMIAEKLILLRTPDSSFVLISAQSIKSFVKKPSINAQIDTTKPLFEIEHSPTKIVISGVSKVVYNRPDLLEFIYDKLEGQYNSSNSQFGPYWMTGLGGAEKDKLSGITYDEGILNRGNLYFFSKTTLSVKDNSGNIKNIPISDIVSYFR